ncbi:2-oxoglutarate-dependent ethylene/succinate-forming enzyme [Cordyceps fumosorosea ARSEF 2679]|uniref:2-oxoglutarate-dependent ethylene/succinate-forming enzyme n=1 Tax=Cordyceps fumosorosea (strain ARSEF 2679) TaxID=1081104 RepID=A0A168CM99_CORFA|nr:2-oxoglutarate-dependent ethylene/succinate-forming enzyme [Cordyceps fumosorosea ARSEF 2679]OAA71551.1 2-oxoglutarate-dependent ethylene/succinate-forming enzyme [Cordyceps fumosorosea ARSEF 2679]
MVGASTMPPGFTATVGRLDTFCLPDKITGSAYDLSLARAMIQAWRRDGIFQIAMSAQQQRIYKNANAASRRFFQRKSAEKQLCVNDKSYAGYIASGEEITHGVADYSEIFTVTKDLLEDDPRVAGKWPCHGPCPWPDEDMKLNMTAYTEDLSRSGDQLIEMIELGLHVPRRSLKRYTEDGWHHMRVLRFPHMDRTNGKGKKGRGIGSHTDYGLLVMAAQDDVGGLFVRPPCQGEHHANWEKSAAGLREDESGWVYVPPVPGVFTVFPGDMMQYMTGSYLKSTPHKVGLNTRERFAFAYFHEPNFTSVIKPLPGYDGAAEAGDGGSESIHYGTHFTNMCLRNYPDRITTKKLLGEDRCKMLALPQLRREVAPSGPSSAGGGGCAGGEAMMRDCGGGGYPVPSVEIPSA